MHSDFLKTAVSHCLDMFEYIHEVGTLCPVPPKPGVFTIT